MLQVITRKVASNSGLARYYTGVPCGRGHTAERYVTSGNCCECASIDAKKYSRNMRASLLGWVPFKMMIPEPIFSDVTAMVEAMVSAHNLMHPPGVKSHMKP